MVIQNQQADPVSINNMYKTNQATGLTSTMVLILGNSGSGKSTSLEDLNPETTNIINVLGKTLPFMDADKYKEGKNMFTLHEATSVLSKMREVSRDQKITDLIIDDGHYIMIQEFMSKITVKGFDKFSIMARNIWNILTEGSKLRPSLITYFLAHDYDDGINRRMATAGKLTDEKLTPAGAVSICLFTDIIMNNGERQYVFTTQSDGNSCAKSPKGMFPYQIPNNLKLVSERVREYYKKIPLEQSKVNLTIS